MMRIGAYLARQDPELWDRWYLAAGTALHVEGIKPHDPEVARSLLAGIGVDPLVVDAAIADRSTADEVIADHEAMVARGVFGAPTLRFADDTLLFGPVLIDPPTGEEALVLWSLVEGWRRFPHLFELKRPKSTSDLTAIAEAFDPYLRARDWESVQRPAPSERHPAGLRGGPAPCGARRGPQERRSRRR
jgi:hypothetical protein